ncbi:related to transposase [Sporisorium reilianum f. sp. reilianum]|uniref:Related to transposase n=1 Tax=Sporisorium reilianum f. sp. reilianum TaxID=72559 RepID=A0A2N8UAY5_9BASI|nr:related to transposase [Sporisorium reilianum f. sp. reilianum]
MQGRRTKKDGHTAQQALPPEAETALVQLIWRSTLTGFLLTPTHIWEHANDVAHGVPGHPKPVNIGEHWMQVFLIQHLSICSHWSCCLDNTCLTGTTEEVVCDWFNCLGKAMCEFRVASTNIFNMDETSFMFGQAASKCMVMPDSDLASQFRVQPGTRESAMVIKCIGSGGQVLPLLIITKGKHHTIGEQRRMQDILASWHFSKSDNGWTNNKIALEWLENVFNRNTRLLMPSEWHLLIINSHRSHMSQAFCDALWAHQIIPFLLPPHATHVMQLLDVSIFGPLMAAYCRIISNAVEHMDAIDKVQFGTFYTQAQEKVLTQSAAQKAFSDSRISLDLSPEKEVAVPHSDSDFNAALDTTLDAHTQEPGSHNTQALKWTLLEANEAAQASIVVLKAENKMLRAQQEQKSKMAAKVGWKVAKGNLRVLSKDIMITCEFAERELVVKGWERLAKKRSQGRREEEEEVLPPATAVDDGGEASEDDEEGVLMLLANPPPPPMQTFLDELDDNEPLSTIDEVDPGGFGFFDTVPVASSSCGKC